MPVRSTIKTLLPDEVRAELDRRLVASEFSDYDGLIEWLREKGFVISHSALGRYSMQFERKLTAIKMASEQARAFVEADPDMTGAMGDALVRLLQQKIFELLLEAQEIGDTGDLAKLARAISQLGRVTIRQREWSETIRERLEAQKTAVGKKIGAMRGEGGGLSDETADAIRRALFEDIDPFSEKRAAARE
ncbi:MAG TPA: phage protein Gp27 family protein [Candidatus Binataceae bacterium]|nr:phage protein Gp27 family protein [Candidatus Binataceae bacterium]